MYVIILIKREYIIENGRGYYGDILSQYYSIRSTDR